MDTFTLTMSTLKWRMWLVRRTQSIHFKSLTPTFTFLSDKVLRYGDIQLCETHIFQWLLFLNIVKSEMPPIFKMVPLVCRTNETDILLLTNVTEEQHTLTEFTESSLCTFTLVCLPVRYAGPAVYAWRVFAGIW